MASVNKIILVGRLGRDPEVRSTAGGKEVASMSLATDETYKDKNGEKQKKTSWHKLTSWISIPFIREYLHAGDTIYVEGKMEYREWEKDGVKKTSAEVNVQDIRPMVTGGGQQQSNSRPAARPAQPPPQRTAQVRDDIDF